MTTTQQRIEEIAEKFDSIGDEGRAWLRQKLNDLARPMREIGESYRLVREFGSGHMFDLEQSLDAMAQGEGEVPKRRTRRVRLWTGQKVDGVTPPPDWVGIRTALDHVFATEGLPGDTISIVVELEAPGYAGKLFADPTLGKTARFAVAYGARVPGYTADQMRELAYVAGDMYALRMLRLAIFQVESLCAADGFHGHGDELCDICRDHVERLRKLWPPPVKPLALRPKVLAMAELMETKLRKHDADWGDDGWVNADPFDLLVRMRQEGEELEEAVTEERKDMAEEAADVANLAMMIVDAAGGLGTMPKAMLRTPEADDPWESKGDTAKCIRCGARVVVMEEPNSDGDRIVCSCGWTSSWSAGRIARYHGGHQ